MQKIIADLHIHSKFSRAVSPKMNLEMMAEMAEIKGIDLLVCGDFTYPEWIKEIKEKLEEDGNGIYKVKNSDSKTRYLLGTEISSIYTQGGKGRRIHTLVFAPDIACAEKFSKALKDKDCNLESDGRPIIGLSVIELCEIAFAISSDFIFVPAHVWTPWFGMLGSKSGFDSLRECYGKYAGKILAIETGLSSDPDMNWQIEEFDKLSIVSFSDSHSPAKLGREVTVFEGEGKFDYSEFKKVLAKKGKYKISKTIEFYPDEGKYHVDGHRKCNVWQLPEKTRKVGRVCPVCGKTLTLGVLGRVDQLSRKELIKVKKKKDEVGNTIYIDSEEKRVPYIKSVPLAEILSEALEKGVNTKTVQRKYEDMLEKLGNEIEILTEIPLKKLKEYDEWIGQAIERVRCGNIYVRPGYDGVFGEVKIWRDEMAEKEDKGQEQMTLL